ncbi:MAG: gliding motility protein GldN [Bacteroidales bacterium]|nr:gliding motility protein GldN [Bacteroidales bacterium]
MKKIFLLLMATMFLQCFITKNSNAQVLQELPYVKNHTQDRRPVAYQFVREADVMWSKIVWRRIELSERANQHLFFPTTPMDGRMSLIDVLLEGIHTQGLIVYGDNGNDEFAKILTVDEVHSNLGSEMQQVQVMKEDGSQVLMNQESGYTSSEILSYLIKELWYFDKQRSVMEVRIIGLCPVRVYQKDPNVPDYSNVQVFWAYYPDIRKLLSNAECFNPQNDAARLNFEDVFEKRLFSSYIYAESNMYDNRSINQYAQNHEILLESEKIKEQIFNFEQDLWEY